MSLLVHDKWSVHLLRLNNEKAFAVWTLLQQHPSLFFDNTSRDWNDWHEFIHRPGIVWLGVSEQRAYANTTSILVGIITLDFTARNGNVDAHLVFFDRKPAEKTELLKQLIPIVFATFPIIKRISTTIPHMYKHTWKLVKRIGMHWEGTQRQVESYKGQRLDMHMFSLLREDIV